MKSLSEIIAVIDTKIQEHKTEMEFSLAEQEKHKKQIRKIKDKQLPPQQLMLESSKLVVLKDKALFHKASVMALEDLKESVK